MQWDLFCRVVDNFGDVGFGWRLAADLAARGEQVRLWLDDPSALAWMAPACAPGVAVGKWAKAGADVSPIADVVVETFGCGLPPAFLASMAARPRPPVWIDVEHLSAESYVGRSHGLPSPRADGPGAGLTSWFFYPGFTEATGGLLREPDLAQRQRDFVRSRWLRSLGLESEARLTGETRIVSLFCYEAPALPALLDALGTEPTLLLAAAGRAARQVEATLGPTLERGALKAVILPRLSQPDYDRLLWASNLNFVRGEDSFVRAQWAGVPFVWQIYPQHDRAHVAKLDAFLDRFLAEAPAALARPVRGLFAGWNGLADRAALPAFSTCSDWREHCRAWRARLWAQADLGTRLVRFARSTMLK